MRHKKFWSSLLVGLLLAQAPLTTGAALADDSASNPPAAQTTTPDPTAPASNPLPANQTNQAGSGGQTGPSSPTGADAPNYTFNSATGMWESDQYIWNPKTGQTTPKGNPGYYYDPAAGKWN